MKLSWALIDLTWMIVPVLGTGTLLHPRLPIAELAGERLAHNAHAKERPLFVDESRLDRDARLA